ncbi:MULTISPECIES: ABC transporter substrate-binding protein [unclassified Bradyrhizobium]|uniref:ABC transporter substrate-binding protein n=1 Tax=unclassified Bradyrhizobium TaxID=2631580 RepID=UPI0029168568|nr:MULTISPECIES: ABC transporter substrate-binding protein [unclassified Bradyrhizobium]
MNWFSSLRISIVLALIAGVLPPGSARADELGVTNDSIMFGQVAALEGPSAALGQAARQGLLAAFNELNAKGGVYGRRLKLASRNDGYDPDRSVVETIKLIYEDKVFALIGAVGTPTAMATAPIAASNDVPFIGPISGAEFLRAPEFQNVVNIRASYAAEAEATIKYLTEELHLTRIAIFYQDDSFGRDVLAGVKTHLDRRGLELAAEGTFERNTRAVGAALKVIRRAEPEAVILVGTYGPCAEFIKMAHRSGFNPTFSAVSFVGGNALAKELGPEGRGVIVSEVVPFPWDTDLRVVADYQAAMKTLDPSQTPDFIGLEGYITGRLVARALAMTGPNPTRAELLRIINEVGQFDIGGLVVSFGNARKENPPPVSLTVIQSDGSFKPI